MDNKGNDHNLIDHSSEAIENGGASDKLESSNDHKLIDKEGEAIENGDFDKLKSGSTKVDNGYSPEWWSVQEAMTISSMLLIFFLIVLSMMTHLIKKGIDPETVLKIFGMILIIAVSAFLVVAGYSSEQIGSVIGLLGTIAGYLLGKSGRQKSE